ncbi:hypothetical protein CTI12_AA470400 [Artemisia annua]|uniref:Uncharacterized protein n=1 Tax=Artemisia annua TaxID=35608 RepID=A0A2U1LNY2_ARTAN|nr:hypothetical protein CTI12_AA470400 [Artemisia annua]
MDLQVDALNLMYVATVYGLWFMYKGCFVVSNNLRTLGSKRKGEEIDVAKAVEENDDDFVDVEWNNSDNKKVPNPTDTETMRVATILQKKFANFMNSRIHEKAFGILKSVITRGEFIGKLIEGQMIVAYSLCATWSITWGTIY